MPILHLAAHGRPNTGSPNPLVPPGEFWAQAACAGFMDDTFFGEKKSMTDMEADRAKRVCGGCPVKEQCLTFAMESGEPHGVWGGMSEDDRVNLRRRRTRATKQATAATFIQPETEAS